MSLVFTVVIPLYNKERHIQRTIDSVLKQTYQDFEIIVVNDGSTDRSVDQVKKVQDSRVLLVCQQNAGVSAARNRGINDAQGELVAFLDADDAWKPDFLETILRLRKKYPHAGVYSTAYEYRTSGGMLVNNSFNTTLPLGWEGIVDDYFKYALQGVLFCSSSVAIRKSVFSEVGLFDTSLVWGEDLNMWCRIALKNDIAFFNKSCAVYFQDTDNRACKRQIDYRKSFINDSETFLEENREVANSFYFEEYMISLIIKKAWYLITDGEQRKARELLLQYKYTKLNKTSLFITLGASVLPSWVAKSTYRLLRNTKTIVHHLVRFRSKSILGLERTTKERKYNKRFDI